MSHQLVELLERVFIEQQIDALAGGELAFFVLPLAALGAAPRFRSRRQLAQFFQPAHPDYCSALHEMSRPSVHQRSVSQIARWSEDGISAAPCATATRPFR